MKETIARSNARGAGDTGRPASTRRRILLLSAVAVLGGIVVLFAFNPSQHAFYPFCGLHRTTGLQCPGCGSLRAMHQLLHGNVAAAFYLNPLFVLSLPLLLWLGIRAAIRKLRNQPAFPSFRPVWLWALLGVMIVFGVLRNLPIALLS